MVDHETARRSPWCFFALAYALSWLFWVPAALFGRAYTASLWVIPYMLGGFGPSVAGIILIYRNRDREGRRAFWRRVVDARRISAQWYVFMLLVFPVTLAGAVLLSRAAGGSTPELATLSQIAANPALIVGLMVTNMLGGPLSEELGWRGVGLDRLLGRWPPLLASLITAPIWVAWHAPLFFMEGTSQHTWGLWTADFWIYAVSVLPLSVLETWCAVKNERSILAPILLHFAYNFTLSLVFPVSTPVFALTAVLLSAAAAGVVLLTGPEESRVGG